MSTKRAWYRRPDRPTVWQYGDIDESGRTLLNQPLASIEEGNYGPDGGTTYHARVRFPHGPSDSFYDPLPGVAFEQAKAWVELQVQGQP